MAVESSAATCDPGATTGVGLRRLRRVRTTVLALQTWQPIEALNELGRVELTSTAKA